MAKYISFRDFDWPLVGIVLLICTIGVLEIYSATLSRRFSGVYIKQIYWVAAGLLLMFIVSLVNYEVLLDNAVWMYLVALGSLVAVLLLGKKYLGARRWIQLPGGAHFQPSEWVKLIIVLAIARYFMELRQRELTWWEMAKAGLLVLF